MRTPAFWYRPPGAAANLLTPLGWLYGAAVRRRFAHAEPYRASVPVVCVGNLVAGGAGKTPVALTVAAALRRAGWAPYFLSRGHGGREAGPVRVDPARHGAADVGDEALLLAAVAPTWIARDRAAGARAAELAGAGAGTGFAGNGVLVLDDGFQNPHLAKDLSLVVVDGAAGFGNGRLVPAGPLREPVAAGLARADGVVVIGEDRAGIAARVAGRLPLFHARLEPAAEARTLAGRRVLAFAGIGRPDKFFATVQALGAHVVERRPFADHHPYRPDEVILLLDRAAALGALPVTTAKDAVRLPPEIRGRVTVVPVALAWDDPAALDRLIATRLTARLAARIARHGA